MGVRGCAQAAAALAVLLALASPAGGARMFAGSDGHGKRKVEHHRKGGKVEHVDVPLEDSGKLAFDPQFANDLELDHEQLPLHPNIHHEQSMAELKERLKKLFPEIDADHDGTITAEELWHHHYSNGMVILRKRVGQDFQDLDTNHDGQLTLKEYLADMVGGHKSEEELQIHEVAHPHHHDYDSFVETTRRGFHLADLDTSGALDPEEFFTYSHPEESNNPNLRLWMLRKELHERDTNVDGKLDEKEFTEGMWGSFHLWEPGDGPYSEEKDVEAAHRKFVLLDTNADAQLDTFELLPVFHDLRPSESRYARLQADHMLEMADENKDGKLTLEEMLENPYVFYSAVQDEEVHDEF